MPGNFWKAVRTGLPDHFCQWLLRTAGRYAVFVQTYIELRRSGAVDITYVPCQSAKILFEYEIWLLKGSENILAATGSTTQVFLDKEYGWCCIRRIFIQTGKRKTECYDQIVG
jgi:hypothetical protein